MNRVSEIVKNLFPKDFEDLMPVKKRWWQKIDFSSLKSGWRLWLICLILVLTLFPAIHYYNRFVMFETQVLTDKAQIEAQLQRRKDLIINLTKTVADYAEHERKMFTYMADKRADSLEQSGASINTLKKNGIAGLSKLKKSNFDGALAKLMALAEAYPQLKLSDNFQRLMETLVDIENRIVERRMAYNTSCNAYTSYIRKFPQKIFAGMFGFRIYPFIKVDEDAALFNRVKY